MLSSQDGRIQRGEPQQLMSTSGSREERMLGSYKKGNIGAFFTVAAGYQVDARGMATILLFFNTPENMRVPQVQRHARFLSECDNFMAFLQCVGKVTNSDLSAGFVLGSDAFEPKEGVQVFFVLNNSENRSVIKVSMKRYGLFYKFLESPSMVEFNEKVHTKEDFHYVQGGVGLGIETAGGHRVYKMTQIRESLDRGARYQPFNTLFMTEATLHAIKYLVTRTFMDDSRKYLMQLANELTELFDEAVLWTVRDAQLECSVCLGNQESIDNQANIIRASRHDESAYITECVQEHNCLKQNLLKMAACEFRRGVTLHNFDLERISVPPIVKAIAVCATQCLRTRVRAKIAKIEVELSGVPPSAYLVKM